MNQMRVEVLKCIPYLLFRCSSHLVLCIFLYRYDYLEFTDSRGIKRRFDMKVGTEKWPRLVTFAGGHRLHFLFHSDGSNNEWGYKFKVTVSLAMSFVHQLFYQQST